MAERKLNPQLRPLRGEVVIPGDKSISHRAAILGLLAEGETRISNFLTAGDCLHTLQACEQLGAQVRRQESDVWIQGRGLQGLQAPAGMIDCGNSGTGVRLLSGVLAGQPFASAITGDEQVQRRPMQRIIDPLTRMGARIESQPGNLCPLRIQGGQLHAIDYLSPVASAQVKSCVLLAGLFAPGKTSVTSPAASRDHTERMLNYFGVPVTSESIARPASLSSVTATGEKVTIAGGAKLTGSRVDVPADISSAAFFLVAAALIPGSKLELKNIGINRTRTGILLCLKEYMGAQIFQQNRRKQSGENVADLVVEGGAPLHGVDILGEDLIPRLIDELPILAVAAAAASGKTTIRNAAELRVKETDRISVLAGELRKIGVQIEELPDGMIIQGGAIRGGTVDSHGDHRLAMSLAVAGLISEQGVTVKNTECVNTSFPGFWELLDGITK